MTDATTQRYRVGRHAVYMEGTDAYRVFTLEPGDGGERSHMRVYRIIPGIVAAFHEYNSPHCGAFNDPAIARHVMDAAGTSRRMLEVNICREGTFRVLSRDMTAITSLLQGDVALALTDVLDGQRLPVGDAQAGWSIDLPTSRYRGIGFIVNLETAGAGLQGMAAMVGIEFDALVDAYRLGTREFVMPADQDIERIANAIERHRNEGSLPLMRLEALELLATIASRPAPGESLVRPQCPVETARLTREARDYAVSHLDERHTIQEISHMFSMSPTVFKKAFRELYGKPYARYMTQKRMERAESMLTAGALVLSASQATGYESPGKFAATFKRTFGETPSAYRARMGS